MSAGDFAYGVPMQFEAALSAHFTPFHATLRLPSEAAISVHALPSFTCYADVIRSGTFGPSACRPHICPLDNVVEKSTRLSRGYGKYVSKRLHVHMDVMSIGQHVFTRVERPVEDLGFRPNLYDLKHFVCALQEMNFIFRGKMENGATCDIC